MAYSASLLRYCAGYLAHDSKPPNYSLKLCSLILCMGLWKLHFTDCLATDFLLDSLKWSLEREWKADVANSLGTLLISPWPTFYFSYSVANSTMNADAFCLKDLPLSFIFYAPELSPKPEDPLSLYADAALNFRWLITPAEKSQVVGLAKYSSLMAFIWAILGGILDTTRRRSPVSTA